MGERNSSSGADRRGSALTEQLFFLLAPMGASLILMGAIFFALAAAFFLSSTRGLLLRFL